MNMRVVRITLVGTLFAVATVVGAPKLLVESPVENMSCAELTAWADENVGKTPRTYAGLMAHHPTKRQYLLPLFSSTERAAVWQEQLRRYKKDNQLTGDQAALLGQLERLFVPAFFEKDESFLAEGAKLTEALQAAFPASEYWLFSRIGKPEVARPSAFARLLGLEGVATVLAQSEWCECSNDSDWCGHAQECGDDGNGCQKKSGCGTGWKLRVRWRVRNHPAGAVECERPLIASPVSGLSLGRPE